MPPRRGLGPQGLRTITRAAADFQRIRSTGPAGNPAATSVQDPGEEDFTPDYWYTFDSTRVSEAAYDTRNHRLYVKWQDGGTGTVYEGVMPNEWKNLRRSGSAGKFVNRVLNTHNYHPF